MTIERVLAIETSCDDTSVAIVNHQGEVEVVCTGNQDALHRPFGGVVPEIASRNHSLAVLPLIDDAMAESGRNWAEIQGLVVTARPGLVGALMVGVITAKSLAMFLNKPFIGVNHLEGHIWAPFLRDASYQSKEFQSPCLVLAVSGGHTSLYDVKGIGNYHLLGQTIDDAAGEAFDKFAKMLGLGYPGGVHVDREARQGDVDAYSFPRSMMRDSNLQFSFSGLKTAGLRKVEELGREGCRNNLANLCASYQEAIVDVLIGKMDRALEVLSSPPQQVAFTGGVSANSRLRERATTWAQTKGLELLLPPLRYCTDNAAMIGYAGIQRLNRGERSEQSLGPSPISFEGEFLASPIS